MPMNYTDYGQVTQVSDLSFINVPPSLFPSVSWSTAQTLDSIITPGIPGYGYAWEFYMEIFLEPPGNPLNAPTSIFITQFRVYHRLFSSSEEDAQVLFEQTVDCTLTLSGLTYDSVAETWNVTGTSYEEEIATTIIDGQSVDEFDIAEALDNGELDEYDETVTNFVRAVPHLPTLVWRRTRRSAPYKMDVSLPAYARTTFSFIPPTVNDQQRIWDTHTTLTQRINTFFFTPPPSHQLVPVNSYVCTQYREMATQIGSVLDKASGALYTAVNENQGVRVSRFKGHGTPRELMAFVDDASNPSLFVNEYGVFVLGVTKRSTGAFEYLDSKDYCRSFS